MATIMSLIFALMFVTLALAQDKTHFTFNGFQGPTKTFLTLDGLAKIQPNGLLQLTNYSTSSTSHVFYSKPIKFNPNNITFSTTFVFAMYPQTGHGIAFTIAPSPTFQHTLSGKYLGLFNYSNNGATSNHIFAVELDTLRNVEFGDIDSNHVGIDVNGLASVDAKSAAYFSDKEGVNKPLRLNSGKPMQIWIDYDMGEMLVNVTLAPFRQSKPNKPLLSKFINLSAIFFESMYVGFSSSTGLIPSNNYILGWSWNQGEDADELDLSKLPSLPGVKHKRSLKQRIFIALLVLVLVSMLMIIGASYVVWRKKFEDFQEPWENEYAPHRIPYKDLYVATKGFKKSELLGVGGFGEVYKGVLPSTSAQVAVKRVSHDSKQGMREFVAEISSMRRLTHRNLVPLLGYCRRKGELLLVYECMPNGSLDKFLFRKDEKSILSWSSRFKIIKGVASALLYLHEEWEQVVLHRDVKASNVLIDAKMNARLDDFGLARLYDHNSTDLRTTHVVGTMGYIAPEVTRTRKPATSADVFAFGMFLLEVSCGRRPIGKRADDGTEDFFLSDWVYECWKKGEIITASDPKLKGNFLKNEIELVMKLGLLCLHPKAEERPKMREVVQYLNGIGKLPDIIPCEYDTPSSLPSFPSGDVSFNVMSSMNSVLQYGR